MRTLVSAFAMLGICLCASIGAKKAEAEENWNMTASWGGGTYLEDAKQFAKLVKQLTDGRVNISVFPAGTLGSPLKVTETVRSNVAQAGHTYMSYDYGLNKAVVLFAGYPGGPTEEEQFIWLYKAGGLEAWREFRDRNFGVVSMPCGTFPTEFFLHSSKKVQSLEDFKGLKLRTSGAWAEIATRLGASTVLLPGGEVYSALERGVIDAAEWASASVNERSGLHKAVKYIILPGIHQPSGAVECQFNKEAWARISERDQQMIELAGKIQTFNTWATLVYDDLPAFRRLQEGENEFVQLDEEFLDAVKSETIKWADEVAVENEEFRKYLNLQRQFLKDISAYPLMRFAPGARTAESIGSISE